MTLPEEFALKTVSAVLKEHPRLGEILKNHNIDCVTCGSSSCLFKNVIATHGYSRDQTARLEQAIGAYLAGL